MTGRVLPAFAPGYAGTVQRRTVAVTPAQAWVVGMVFAVVDVATTWYALTALHLREVNPLAKWAIAHFGLGSALGFRVIGGAVVLGLIAWGSVAPMPRHRGEANRAFAGLLSGVVVVWGVVAVANAIQIAFVKLG